MSKERQLNDIDTAKIIYKQLYRVIILLEAIKRLIIKNVYINFYKKNKKGLGKMNIKSITILGGYDKLGKKEKIERLDIMEGDIFSIVGPTGSGKSSLIDDIEQIAQGDTFSRRKVLFDGRVPSSEFRTDPRKKIIAYLAQTMNFLADMSVEEFILLHSKCRGIEKNEVDHVISLANTLTGESISKESNLTILSGGQSRALMVADIAVISDSPIVLIDEIENAGIRKKEALELLAGNGKIVMVVTHDPVLALMSKKRIIMKNGGMSKVVNTTQNDCQVCNQLNYIDNIILKMRETVRNGENMKQIELESIKL